MLFLLKSEILLGHMMFKGYLKFLKLPRKEFAKIIFLTCFSNRAKNNFACQHSYKLLHSEE